MTAIYASCLGVLSLQGLYSDVISCWFEEYRLNTASIQTNVSLFTKIND